jgi:hypothetical protein
MFLAEENKLVRRFCDMNDIQCPDRFRKGLSDPCRPGEEGRAGKMLWADIALALRSKGFQVDQWKPTATKAHMSAVVMPALLLSLDEPQEPAMLPQQPPQQPAQLQPAQPQQPQPAQHPLQRHVDDIERQIGLLRIGGELAADVMDIVRNVLAR